MIAQRAGAVHLPGCQSGLDALRQGAGGGRFIELLLRSGQRSQHAHWNHNKRYSHMCLIQTLPQKAERTHVFVGGGVAVGVLNDQVI